VSADRPVTAAAIARHAGAVPSFVIPMVRNKLLHPSGAIEPLELICWERPYDLTESARADLRRQVIARLRVRNKEMWAQFVRVHLHDGWDSRVLPADRRRIQAWLAQDPPKPLQDMTLRDVSNCLGGNLERLFALLAQLEALYWTPPLRKQQHYRTALTDKGAPAALTPALRATAEGVLALPWLPTVRNTDLRFGYPGKMALPDWIRQQLQRPSVSGFFADLIHRLAAADAPTAIEEAQTLAMAVGETCVPRINAESTGRWVHIFMSRHISPDGAGRTLEEVGTQFAVTRERIRQICAEFEAVFAESQACTPALDRLFREASGIAPCNVSHANEQLRALMGDGAGIESLLAWATLLKKKPAIRCRTASTRVSGSPVAIKVIERTETASWGEALTRHVIRDCSMFGCTNVLRIAGLLALREGAAPGQPALEAALQASVAGFRWLDRASGWFTVGDGSISSAANRVRKIMAVAHEHVGTDQIAAAFASDDGWMLRETQSIGLATPPVHVLRDLFRGWPWLQVKQHSRFLASDSFDPSGVLSPAEQLSVDVISSHDGVACRFEIAEALRGDLKITEMAVSFMLGSSPIFDKLEHGLYRLIGRRVGDEAVNAARRRSREHGGSTPASMAGEKLGPDEFFANVTEASLRNEQYSVPNRFIPRFAGKDVPAWNAEGDSLGDLRVTQSGKMTRLNAQFPGAVPGDSYLVSVLPEGLKVRLCKAPGEANAI
jgi:hypothetical protein